MKSLERQALDTIGKKWKKAKLTREKLIGNTRRIASFLVVQYGLQRIDTIKPHMVEKHLESLREKGRAPSTLQGYATAWRTLAEAVGKANIVPRDNESIGAARKRRCNPKKPNKSGLEEIRTALITRAESTGDPRDKMLVAAEALRESFGVRAKESLSSSTVVEKNGVPFLFVEGTKGGRTRLVEIRTSEQWAAVQLVKDTARDVGSGTGRIIPPAQSLKQAYDYQRNTIASLGGAKCNNTNMHVERHGYAQERKEEGASDAKVMDELGHGGKRSPGFYVPVMRKE